MTAALLLLAAGAMLPVRLGWGGERRGVAVAGWTAAAAALAGLAARDGAWGLAMGTVAGMVAALAAVLYAGWRSPLRPARAPREAPAVLLPRHWRDLPRRLAVFVLVVPVGFAAAQGLAFGAQALARRGGAAEADAIVLALFLQPVAWTAIMAIQMTRETAARMVAAPALAAALGALLWGAS